MPPLTIYLSEDVKKLLHNKFVVIIGDSNQRGIYKDLISLLQGDEYLSSKDLRGKGELHFMNDVLLEGGKHGKMTNGINYREVRQFRTDYHLVRFYFVTRVHNKYWEEVIFPDLQCEPVPDVIILNSCLWDISRYERRGGVSMMESYKDNLETTFGHLNRILPLECLVLWTTTLPVAAKIRGGFMIPEIEHLCKTFRLDVMQANYYTKELARLYEVDVLDLNFYFRHQMHRQVGDGTHWNYMAHRRITNLILAHVAVAWGVALPRGRLPPAVQCPPDDRWEGSATSAPDPNPDKVGPTSDGVPLAPTDGRETTRRSTPPIPVVDRPCGQVTLEKRKEEGGGRHVTATIASEQVSHSEAASVVVCPPPGQKSGSSVEGTKASSVKPASAAKVIQSGGDKVAETEEKLPVQTVLPVDRRIFAKKKEEASSLKDALPPDDAKPRPIEVTGGCRKGPCPPFLQASSGSHKDRVPRSGNRYQPYAQHPRPSPPMWQPLRPQPHQNLRPPYSQPVLPYHVTPGVSQAGVFPNPVSSHGRRPPYPAAVNSYANPSYNEYLNRVNQRIAAERSNQMTRDLLYEAMLRFN